MAERCVEQSLSSSCTLSTVLVPLPTQHLPAWQNSAVRIQIHADLKYIHVISTYLLEIPERYKLNNVSLCNFWTKPQSAHKRQHHIPLQCIISSFSIPVTCIVWILIVEWKETGKAWDAAHVRCCYIACCKPLYCLHDTDPADSGVIQDLASKSRSTS